MNIIVKGQIRRFLGAGIGPDKVAVEMGLGQKRIWPNPSGIARRIVVELPKPGTEEWQYWVHAVHWTSIKASKLNALWFTVNGIKYYINNSIDDTEPYKLSENSLIAEFDGVAIDELGEYLDVECKIEPEIDSREVKPSKEKQEIKGELPLLFGSRYYLRYYGRTGASEYNCGYHLRGTPGNNMYAYKKKRHLSSRVIHKDNHILPNIDETDTGWISEVDFSGDGKMPRHEIIYGRFMKRFKLKIISVE